MAQAPTSNDIDFVIARGEALVSQARDLVARWEQGLVQVGITPEMAARMQQGLEPQDLQTLMQSARQPAAFTAHDAVSNPAATPDPEGSPAAPSGPSLQAARRAARRLRHV